MPEQRLQSSILFVLPEKKLPKQCIGIGIMYSPSEINLLHSPQQTPRESPAPISIEDKNYVYTLKNPKFNGTYRGSTFGVDGRHQIQQVLIEKLIN